MKKSEKIQNSKVRKKTLDENKLKEKSIQGFLSIVQSSLKLSDWNKYYREADEHAGNSLYIFEYMIFALKETQTEISKPLREAIDKVIDENQLQRSRIKDLEKLNYTSYWKQQYGYN